MPTYRLEIAYDGGRFAGWARQPGLRTVQGEIEVALERLLGERAELTAAGRTDAGVHALGQVASFVTDREPPEALLRALNALTGPEIAILAAEPARDGFDARRDARSRRYRYRVLAAPIAGPFERGRAMHWPHPLDRAALQQCAATLVGSHDFTAFTPTDTEHVRFKRKVIEARWSEERRHGAGWDEGGGAGGRPGAGGGAERGALLSFEIEADAFMRNMVRVLVGTMLEVAGGRRSVAELNELLTGRPRSEAGETAPAHGLYLLAVTY